MSCVDALYTTSTAPEPAPRMAISIEHRMKRKLRDCLRHPSHPLPHYRVDGAILVHRCEFDAWIATYRQVGDTDGDQIVGEVSAELD